MARKLFAEWLGTLFLLATVVGSGIMAENLSGGNDAIALLGNTIATGAILAVLILMFGNISGAHFNPAVTIAFLIRKEIEPQMAVVYIAVQIMGAIAGVLVAHAMFGHDLIDPSLKMRTGIGQWLGEFVATFGLVSCILACLKFRPNAIPYAVGLYITAAYWFTSSTSFANPAVTIARSLSNTFSGIAPDHVLMFIFSQILAAFVATKTMSWLVEGENE